MRIHFENENQKIQKARTLLLTQSSAYNQQIAEKEEKISKLEKEVLELRQNLQIQSLKLTKENTKKT